MVAGIAVSAASYSIDKLYSYRIPENMTLQPGQRVQQGGFTTAGGTQYTAHLPLLDGQVDIIQSDYLFIAGPVHLAEIFGLHHVLHIFSPSRRKIIFH